MATQIQGAQRDFTSGEVDVALKRADDHPARKTGLRQMRNARILNSAAVQDRPGRSALYPITQSCTRVEEFTISPGVKHKIEFGPSCVQFRSATNVVLNTFVSQLPGFTALPWTALTLQNVVYAVFGKSVYVTFAGMRPQVYTWDGVSTWSVAPYNELLVSGQKRTPFYRISPPGITLLPSAQSGAGDLIASTNLFSPAWVGTRVRYIGRQILITGYYDPTRVAIIIQESLPGQQVIGFGSDPTNTFSLGDEVIGSVSGSRGLIVGINGISKNITVQLLTETTTLVPSSGGSIIIAFQASEGIVGPAGSLVSIAVSGVGNPAACTIWDEEIMNDLRGYPASCFVDQYRLGFCNFPSLPNGILWSAINSPTDAYANNASSPDNAIFELAPDKVQVFYVVPGAESSEFIFCDRRLYYIKIDASTPLKPGSVGFQVLSSDGCAQVQPRNSEEVTVYVNAGRNSMMAIVTVGNYYRPFNTKNLSNYHGHLFNNIVAIAMPNADSTFNERYAYVLNGDGSLVVGKYTISDGQVAGSIGWGPWDGVGAASWVSAWDANVYFVSSYFGTAICEVLDDTKYLDANILVNNLPATFAPPGGKGPLWWIPSRSVSLMDQGQRSMGIYQIDANGFIVPQFNGGENLNAASLVAGQQWTMIVEPFCPDASPGNDVGQRMYKRRISRFAIYVVQSTGFLMARLFAGPVTRTSPALGTVMNSHRVTAYNQDDDATLPPPLRETVERSRPLGRAFDPRVAIIKDTPGPLQVLEIGIEASI
jgi:hypothetical protein